MELVKSQNIPKWDDSVREYLQLHKKTEGIITQVVEEIVSYIKTDSNLLGLQLRFLNDPDDPHPMLILEVHRSDSLSTPDSKRHKKKMRQILTRIIKDNSSNETEFIKIRAFVSLFLRAG